MEDYTAALDSEGWLSLCGGDALSELYRVHHRADGVIELQPQTATDADRISSRTLRMMERSMNHLAMGKTSMPVDLGERFSGPGDALASKTGASPETSVAELAAEIERLRIEVGLSTDELLESLVCWVWHGSPLWARREASTRERYGNTLVDGLTVPDREA